MRKPVFIGEGQKNTCWYRTTLNRSSVRTPALLKNALLATLHLRYAPTAL